MSAVAITLVEFANTFAAKTNARDVPYIHPAGATTICWWLDEMLMAAEAGRTDEVVKLTQMVADKVALERAFNAENEATAARSGRP
jgi:hypothetical protein